MTKLDIKLNPYEVVIFAAVYGPQKMNNAPPRQKVKFVVDVHWGSTLYKVSGELYESEGDDGLVAWLQRTVEPQYVYSHQLAKHIPLYTEYLVPLREHELEGEIWYDLPDIDLKLLIDSLLESSIEEAIKIALQNGWGIIEYKMHEKQIA